MGHGSRNDRVIVCRARFIVRARERGMNTATFCILICGAGPKNARTPASRSPIYKLESARKFRHAPADLLQEPVRHVEWASHASRQGCLAEEPICTTRSFTLTPDPSPVHRRQSRRVLLCCSRALAVRQERVGVNRKGLQPPTPGWARQALLGKLVASTKVSGI